MAWFVAIVGVVLVVAVVGYFLGTRKVPENVADHHPSDVRGSTLFFSETNDRPAGPGAEDEAVPERGQPAPGPSAASLPQQQPER
jgi:hypothetical protein